MVIPEYDRKHVPTTEEKIQGLARWALFGDAHAHVPRTMEELVDRVEQALRTARSKRFAKYLP
jgi:hypothetical protein